MLWKILVIGGKAEGDKETKEVLPPGGISQENGIQSPG
jgi:hypothetical protein